MRGAHSYRLAEGLKHVRAVDETAPCYIVGPMKLQNELMAAYLKSEIGSECLAVKDIRQLRKGDLKNECQQRLLFLDCQGKSLKVLMAAPHTTEVRGWSSRLESSISVVSRH